MIANPLGFDFFLTVGPAGLRDERPAGHLVYRWVGMIRPIINCLRSWRVIFLPGFGDVSFPLSQFVDTSIASRLSGFKERLACEVFLSHAHFLHVLPCYYHLCGFSGTVETHTRHHLGCHSAKCHPRAHMRAHFLRTLSRRLAHESRTSVHLGRKMRSSGSSMRCE